MWPYWVIFLIPALTAAIAQPTQLVRADGTGKIKISAAWVFVMIVLTCMIGFRDRVGGDWYNYFRDVFHAEYMTYSEALMLSDPAYKLLNVWSVQMGLGVVGVNLVCGFVFTLGMLLYCLSMPRPWLALAVAIPYMTVVVSMGYSRQGVALGFAMIGLVALGRTRFLWFAFWIFLAATFHRSAVVLICIPLLNLNFRNIKNIPILGLILFLLYTAFLEGKTDQFTEQYINQKMHSDGAFVRILMNVIPALVLVLFRKRMNITPAERKIYVIMAFFAIGSFAALVSGAVPSTALDRMNLYIIPLQIFVFANLPDSLGRADGQKQAIAMMILAFYALVLFVWLNFANFSGWWQPYRMFPPLDPHEAFQLRRSDK